MARILVIEDNATVQALIHYVLTAAGHVVFLANDGHEGLRRYRCEHPDLVITDIFLPNGDGLDVILELAPRNVDIIAMSAGGDLDPCDHLDDAIQFGACRSLAKPFAVDALVAAVNQTLAGLKLSDLIRKRLDEEGRVRPGVRWAGGTAPRRGFRPWEAECRRRGWRSS
jgi:DNA-binding response OmpR family regulator